VASADGTRLGAIRAGSGPSVVLVHGVMGSKDDWSAVMPRLVADFEVTAFDRRGRGASQDGTTYDIEREIDDVLAVIDASLPPVHLIGHSFGAILALLVAACTQGRVDKLVLYEPPVGGAAHAGTASLAFLEAAVAADDLDAAVAAFASMANITGPELQAQRSNELLWAALRDAVRTAGREIRAAMGVLPIDDRVLESVSADTLVLLGSQQDAPTYSGLGRLAEQLPSGSLARVPGHHLALVFEPDAFTTIVRSFLTGQGSPGSPSG
jgi:pimeloyl-ACP methyl ester carboxylesterase